MRSLQAWVSPSGRAPIGRAKSSRPTDHAKVFHHEANVSTEPDQTASEARIPRTDEDPFGPSDLEAPASKGTQTVGDQRRVQVAVGVSTGRFGRADRLLDSREFQRISREGRRVVSAEFVMLIGRSASKSRRRLGISASRRVGNAVVRNRIKRAVREWFRRRRNQMPGEIDLVVIARRKAREMPRGSTLAQALDRTFEYGNKQKRGSR